MKQFISNKNVSDLSVVYTGREIPSQSRHGTSGQADVFLSTEAGDDCLFGCHWLRWSVLCFVIAIVGIVATTCVFALTKHRAPFEVIRLLDVFSNMDLIA